MTQVTLWFLLWFLLAFGGLPTTESPVQQRPDELEITLTEVRHEGMLMIGVYREREGFTKINKAYRQMSYKANGESTVSLTFDRLEKGTYAIALFQDLNNNGKLDKNFFGIPTEPYAFSNNVKPRFSAPTYDDCKFSLPMQSKLQIRILNP
ncbi:MAG TPA: DUF2141 domain-containing protein [Flavisolibacter sp.]|jgi:uncharacterized protein (DUF2141 family)|nr:DUF2141 domain-containing protein [Flavisolibacter sp.]